MRGLDFQHGPWRVRWSGWRDAVNQHFTFGYWYATQEESDVMVAATTTGTCRVYLPMQVLDMTLEPGWTLVTPDTPNSKRITVEKRALDRLVEHLKSHEAPAA